MQGGALRVRVLPGGPGSYRYAQPPKQRPSFMVTGGGGTRGPKAACRDTWPRSSGPMTESLLHSVPSKLNSQRGRGAVQGHLPGLSTPRGSSDSGQAASALHEEGTQGSPGPGRWHRLETQPPSAELRVDEWVTEPGLATKGAVTQSGRLYWSRVTAGERSRPDVGALGGRQQSREQGLVAGPRCHPGLAWPWHLL